MKKVQVNPMESPEVSLHEWVVSPRKASEIQTQLSRNIICQNQFSVIKSIAGVDTGFLEAGNVIRAAVCVLDYPDLREIENSVTELPSRFPNIPGLLSFRETPAICEACCKLTNPPDMLFCDGHGLAHPRRFGLACHLGLLLDIPSIGIAKSLLVGVHDTPDETRGSWQPIIFQDQVIGAALRTQTGVKPVYVSIGHRISLETAIEYVLRCTPKYRLPAPIRLAHHLASSKPEKISVSTNLF